MINKDINIKLPKSWNEITLGMLEEVEGQNDNPIKIIAALSKQPEDVISSLPVQFVDSISKNIEFLKQMPNVAETNEIRYKGERYMINFMEKLTFGEYCSLQEVMRANPHAYSTFLAILCRKPDEKYTSEFENTILKDRITMFKNMPVKKVLGLVAFFLQLYIKLMTLDKTYQQTKQNTLEEIENTVTNLKSSCHDGVGNGWRTRYVTNRLKRLKKIVKNRL